MAFDIGLKTVSVLVVIIMLVASVGQMASFATDGPVGTPAPEPYTIPEDYLVDFQLVLPMDIHIVSVGVNPGVIQPATMKTILPEEYHPADTMRMSTFNEFHEPIRYEYTYRYHSAPDWFAEDLFAFANSQARYAGAPQYLIDYDSESGQNRLSDSRLIQYVNVTSVEDWIGQNKAAAGLEFTDDPKPSYTIFLLDSYSNDMMPTDTYHYFEHREDYRGGGSTHNMRAWGGNYDFLFLDLSAAPSDGEPMLLLFPGDTATTDPPIWEYDSSTYSELNELIAYDIKMGIYFRLTPSYLYHPTYAPTYFLNVHYFKEDGISTDAGPESEFNDQDFLARMQTAIPWANFESKVTYYDLPRDDPGMQDALETAKERGHDRYVDPKPVADYVELNREQYFEGPEDAFNVFVGIYLFKDYWGFAAPMIIGGIAYDRPDGLPWGIFLSNNDRIRSGGGGRGFTDVAVHEAGHFWGYPHPHDGMQINDNEEYEIWIEPLWDQSATIMSYRVVPYGFDRMNNEFLARGQVAVTGGEVQRNLRVAFQEAGKQGVTVLEGDNARLVRIAEEKLAEAKTHIQEGREFPGIETFLVAYNASVELRERLEPEWSIDHVTWNGEVTRASTQINRAMGLSYAANPYIDYRRFPVEDNMEAFRVTVSWTNSDRSNGDLFVGYGFDRDQAGAMFDLEQTSHAQVSNQETVYIDLDDDGFREWGYFWAGMGTVQPALNCDYTVDIEIFYRE